jgi:hypothetical protein
MSSVKEHLKPSQTVSQSTDRMRSGAGAGHEFRPLTHNAYRILGLPCSASQKEIFDAASSVRRALKLGVRKSLAEDLPWLGPFSRTEMDVRDALSRLANPAQRIYERLFWFYDRQAAQVSRLDDLQPAVDRFMMKEDGAGRHDAALLSLAVALRLHPLMEEKSVWLQSLALWKESVEAKEFWSLLMSSDLQGDFEQLVTFAEIKELRQRVLQLISAPVADVAKDAAARKDYKACRRALTVLRESGLPLKLIARHENDILGPIEDELTTLCEEVFRQVQFFFDGPSIQSRKEKCDHAFYKFKEELRPGLKRFLDLAGAESLSVYRIFEMTAAGLKSLASSYGIAGEEATGVKLYRKALALAPPGSIVAAEIEEALRPLINQNYFKMRTESDYYLHLAEELESLPIWVPSYPTLPPRVEQEPQKTLGWATVAIIIGLAMAAGVICNKGGGSSSYNSNLPGYYNANMYRPSYNVNTNIPQPRFSPMPPLKIEPLVIPSLEPNGRRSRVERRKNEARQNSPQ